MDEEQRVAEITALLEAKDWRLGLQPVEGEETWEAMFFPATVGATTATMVYGLARLDAAESAWAKYQREPWLGSS
jgi:hypothetical protein